MLNKVWDLLVISDGFSFNFATFFFFFLKKQVEACCRDVCLEFKVDI